MAIVGNGSVFGATWAPMLNAYNWGLNRVNQEPHAVTYEPQKFAGSIFLSEPKPNQENQLQLGPDGSLVGGSAIGRNRKRMTDSLMAKPSDESSNNRQDTYDSNIRWAELVLADVSKARIEDVDRLHRMCKQYELTDEKRAFFAEALLKIYINSSDKEVRSRAHEKIDELYSSLCTVMKKLKQSSSTVKIEIEFLWGKLEAAVKRNEEGDRNHVMIAEAVQMLCHLGDVEAVNQLITHREPIVRNYVLGYIVDVVGMKEMIPHIWDKQKSMIKREIDEYEENESIGADAIQLLLEYGMFGCSEAADMIVDIYKTHYGANIIYEFENAFDAGYMGSFEDGKIEKRKNLSNILQKCGYEPNEDLKQIFELLSKTGRTQ